MSAFQGEPHVTYSRRNVAFRPQNGLLGEYWPKLLAAADLGILEWERGRKSRRISSISEGFKARNFRKNLTPLLSHPIGLVSLKNIFEVAQSFGPKNLERQLGVQLLQLLFILKVFYDHIAFFGMQLNAISRMSFLSSPYA